ncbi:hypothetical protein E3N88_24813 [Mikania micrantha]|uniref:Bifunctional inhibitor/plant lipid transfer protein/seed storage helical domain-containing protein n=1 Tax=Mikania micrantha TaxID=192012 RepID=A0A5N6N2Z9_9ASTR|nr:hypothetical protein E3N88_24813 [Mikania micrantha]
MAASSSLTVVVTLLIIVVSISTAHAQTQTCAANLIPCAQYINSTTTPPSSCCDPIRQAVANDLPCLCSLYQNPSFLAGFGVNVTQALRLPQRCGIPADVTACKTTAQAPGGSTTQPPPGSTPGGNNAGKIASSGVIGLLFISTCVMLF